MERGPKEKREARAFFDSKLIIPRDKKKKPIHPYWPEFHPPPPILSEVKRTPTPAPHQQSSLPPRSLANATTRRAKLRQRFLSPVECLKKNWSARRHD